MEKLTDVLTFLLLLSDHQQKLKRHFSLLLPLFQEDNQPKCLWCPGLFPPKWELVPRQTTSSSMGGSTLEVNFKWQWLCGNLRCIFSATVLGANRKPISLVWTPPGQRIYELPQGMVSAVHKVDLARDLYPLCSEWQKPWAQSKAKMILNLSPTLDSREISIWTWNKPSYYAAQ